jgi:hypothetical protein
MAHPLSTNLEVGYLDTASITDNALVPDGFELTAVTLPFFGCPKDPLAEQTVFFGPECPIIDCFRLFHFPV